MLDSNDLIDAVIAALQTNSYLVAMLANGDPNSIYPHRYGDPNPMDQQPATSMNFEQLLQEQKRGTIMVACRGIRTGTKMKSVVTEHYMACYLKPLAYIYAANRALVDGPCASTGMPLRLSTIHPKCNPPDDFECTPATMYIGQGYMVFDMFPATFTLAERGLDTTYP